MKHEISGRLYGWGAGHTGVLGNGPCEDNPIPQPIPDLPEVRAVATGESAVYAIDVDGDVWSWGWDAFHHLLGRGTVAYPLPFLPTALRGMGHAMTGRNEGDGGVGKPARIEGLPAVAGIAVANENVYALSTAGEVWVWGDASGLGRNARKKADTPETIAALSDIVSITASPGGYACYALDSKQRVWSWGNGHEGELGHGKRRADPIPHAIPALERVSSIHAGDFCAWALLDDGTVWFWGNGQHIDLTVRNTYRVKEPVRIEALDGISKLWTGPSACIAKKSNGETYGLGSALEEMLAVEMNGQRVARMAACDAFEQISLGEDHGLAIDADGNLIGFGDAAQGALGNGICEEQQFFPPASVNGMAGVIAAKAGNNFSFAIIADSLR